MYYRQFLLWLWLLLLHIGIGIGTGTGTGIVVFHDGLWRHRHAVMVVVVINTNNGLSLCVRRHPLLNSGLNLVLLHVEAATAVSNEAIAEEKWKHYKHYQGVKAIIN